MILTDALVPPPQLVSQITNPETHCFMRLWASPHAILQPINIVRLSSPRVSEKFNDGSQARRNFGMLFTKREMPRPNRGITSPCTSSTKGEAKKLYCFHALRTKQMRKIDASAITSVTRDKLSFTLSYAKFAIINLCSRYHAVQNM